MPPSSRQRMFMKLLVVIGGVTFFARCFDQARPYWSVISGKKPGVEQPRGEAPPRGEPSSRTSR